VRVRTPYTAGANLNDVSERGLDTLGRTATHLKSGQYYPHVDDGYDEDGLREQILVDVDRERVGCVSYRNRHKPVFPIVLK